jgi:hypothetical protein
MFEEYKAEYKANKKSIDAKVRWNVLGAIVFIAVVILLG